MNIYNGEKLVYLKKRYSNCYEPLGLMKKFRKLVLLDSGNF